jgi:signal peptidase I
MTKRDSESRSTPHRQSAGNTAREWMKSGLIGFLIFLVVRTFLIQTFTIVSGSMEGTLLVGDFLVLNKSAYGAQRARDRRVAARLRRAITRRHHRLPGHHENIDLVKRLVGMPGDTLAMRDGRLYRQRRAAGGAVRAAHRPERRRRPPLDGLAGAVPDGGLASRPYYPPATTGDPSYCPPTRFFVLGDNRDESLDWGFPLQIKGRRRTHFSYNNRPSRSSAASADQ